ncbi:SIR2 family protein [Nocardioides sp. STR2]|uniref:SIR2 family protein n=1 Tax=Nocardioides pini TaxID=2975053 RepID=A0ABT4CCQ0_9ACTN|nr:SIR2 family protein [Nocardioides pini]MCY4725919.1 SIR2 family protein [Nocardioides pini]
MSVTDHHASVLQDYPSAVLALRGALRDQRLGLMLGAGVSRAFDFGGGSSPPSWPALVERLEEAVGFDASAEAYQKLSLTQRVDILFREYLRSKHLDDVDVDGALAAEGQWRDLIREHLYDDAPAPDQLLSHHPYLQGLLDLVLNSPLTITYNFDSYLEEALSDYYRRGGGSPVPGGGRPYETVLDATVPQRRQKSVLFHINGYLPRNPLEAPSDQLVFSEAEFSDQLMMTAAGRYATMAHHLLNNVYLLVGLSLDDPNLRHMLRTHARTSPGRIHFVVRYLEKPCRRADLTPLQQSIGESGFDLHNLFTLYLSSEQIAALTELISMDGFAFRKIADAAGVDCRRVYYLSGVPGIGKTTTLRHMGGLMCLDEWMEEPSPLLSHPFSDLTEVDREALDRWVAVQFRMKNAFLHGGVNEGIVIVERGPLDPLAFEHSDRIPHKAREYASRVEVSQQPLAAGHIVVMHGNAGVVSRRISGRQSRVQAPQYLDTLQQQIRALYGAGAGVSSWMTTDLSIEELVKRVARLIYLEDYVASDVQGRLDELATGRSTPGSA